jgi:hypothetical protein
MAARITVYVGDSPEFGHQTSPLKVGWPQLARCETCFDGIVFALVRGELGQSVEITGAVSFALTGLSDFAARQVRHYVNRSDLNAASTVRRLLPD